MKVHHIGYLIKDMERAIREFKELGFCVKGEIQRNTERGVDICFIQNEGTLIELVCPYREDSDVSGLMKKYKNMPYHICYCSESLQADIEKLKKTFVQITEITLAPAIHNSRVVFLMNRAMGIIELVEERRNEE